MKRLISKSKIRNKKTFVLAFTGSTVMFLAKGSHGDRMVGSAYLS
jgi:hypothetical protein